MQLAIITIITVVPYLWVLVGVRVDVGLVEVVDGRVHEAGGVGGLHDGQRLGGVSGEGVLDPPVVEVVDVLLAVAVARVAPEDVEDGGAKGEEDEDGHAHTDGHLHLWAKLRHLMFLVCAKLQTNPSHKRLMY